MDLSIIQTQVQGTEIVTLDITYVYTFTYPSKVTAFPVETGAVISDHVINEQFKLKIEGEVSEAHTLFFPGSSRRRDAFDALVRIRDSRSPFTVVTYLKSYSNMIFTNLEFSINPTSGESLPISMEFAQILLVAAQSVQVPGRNTSSDAADKAAPKSNLGTQPTKPVDKSVAHGFVFGSGANPSTVTGT